MTLTYPVSEIDAMLKSRAALPSTALPSEASLLTDVGSIAVGDLMMLDTSTLATDLSYTTITTPATATLGTGVFCVVTGLGSGAGAISTLVRVKFWGEVDLNLAANSGIGAVFCAADGVKTVTTTTTAGAKLLGWTKETGTGVKKCYFDGRGINSANALITGTEEVFIRASDMVPSTTAGSSTLAAVETSTNDVMVQVLDFDQTTEEYAQFTWVPPKRWDLGTITIQPYWMHSAGTAFLVTWGAAARAFSNDDALDAAFGTAVLSSDTGGTAVDLYIAPETGPITIAGTPALADAVIVRVYRDADHASLDTLDADARLLGVKLRYTVTTVIDT